MYFFVKVDYYTNSNITQYFGETAVTVCLMTYHHIQRILLPEYVATTHTRSFLLRGINSKTSSDQREASLHREACFLHVQILLPSSNFCHIKTRLLHTRQNTLHSKIPLRCQLRRADFQQHFGPRFLVGIAKNTEKSLVVYFSKSSLEWHSPESNPLRAHG